MATDRLSAQSPGMAGSSPHRNWFCRLAASPYMRKFELDKKTREAAKRIAPHLDIAFLFQEWVEWIAKSGKVPRNPRNAFLGYVLKKAKQFPPA